MEINEFDHNPEISQFFTNHWGCDFIVSGEEKLYGKDLPGFIVHEDGKIAGLLTYHLKNNECEIVTLDSLKQNSGIGSTLVEAMVKKSKR